MAINYAKTVGLIKMPPTITIGTRTYPLVRLGDYEIMIDNVSDYGTLNTHYVKKTDIGVCYYYPQIVSSLFASVISDGFQVVDNSILQNIFNSLTGTNQEKTQKMLGSFNTTWNGTNETGLNLMPYGFKDYYGWQEYGVGCVACVMPDGNYKGQEAYLSSGVLSFRQLNNWSGSNGVPLRFAKHI